MAILAQMQALAKSLPEYPVVRAMGSVGNVLAPKLIAEIGDVRRFHSEKALLAHAGIDEPPYQSGQFIGTERKISKRGSSSLRKIGHEVMRCLKTHKEPEDTANRIFHRSNCCGKNSGLSQCGLVDKLKKNELPYVIIIISIIGGHFL